MIPPILQTAYALRRAIRNAAIIFGVSFFVGLGLALGWLVALRFGVDWAVSCF